MFEAAAQALGQMFSPPFRKVLWKSVGLAVIFLILIGIGLQRLLSWTVTRGGAWVETTFSSAPHSAVNFIELMLSIVAGLGVLVGMVFLMPAVTALVASFFSDQIASHVENDYYPADPPGKALPAGRALWEGSKTALLAVALYLCAVPFLLFAGIGAIMFFFAAAFLLSREYFELAAMRFRSPAEAKALRKRHAGYVFMAGLMIAAFVSIPILNLATPLFAMALMVHIHKRLTTGRAELIPPTASSRIE
ncbi:MAG: CysZ protein [Variibacter sp.]|jgi:uncharacterized protein involved in cysteine biosynthesis|nr:CysZ protein [Variibacter sp.]